MKENRKTMCEHKHINKEKNNKKETNSNSKPENYNNGK